MAPAPTSPGAVEPPVQARARRSYHRLLEAAESLLEERSFEALTVDEICERAGYTKGAFYHRFDSKTALLRHLVARLTEGAEASWEAFLEPGRWGESSLPDALGAVVRRVVAAYVGRRGVMRVFVREARWGSDPGIRARAARLNRRVMVGVARLLRERSSEASAVAVRDPEGAARFWIASLFGVLEAAALWPPEGVEPERDGAALEARLRELLVPYLVAGDPVIRPAPGRSIPDRP